MKTIFIITGIAATFIFTKNTKPHEVQKQEYRAYSITSAQLDSILEAGRIEKMKTKFI